MNLINFRLQSSLSQAELQKIFLKYATSPPGDSHTSSVMQASVPSSSSTQSLSTSATPPEPSLVSFTESSILEGSISPSSTSIRSSSTSTLVQPSASSLSLQASSSTPVLASASAPDTASSPPIDSYYLTLNGFSAFLLSADNAAFTDQHGRIWQDMTRPLSDYFISTSHNTYLVGHQLVGVSTVEGYIRALLHSCRSVERASTFLF